MNITAVIHRELKEESRRPLNYWLRLAMLFFAVPLFGVILFEEPSGQRVWTALGPVWQAPSPSQSGARLFASLNGVVFIAIWILAPVMTADCVSRERREGTLGLLFLTPLKALDIILGKSFLHGVRSLNVLVGILPLFTIPFILGGITFKEICVVCATNGASLMLALCAGILASTFGRDLVRTMICALAISAAFAWVFMTLHYVSFNALHARNGIVAVEEFQRIWVNWNQPVPARTWRGEWNVLWSKSFFQQGETLLRFNSGLLEDRERTIGNNWNRIWIEAQARKGQTSATEVFRSWMALLGLLLAASGVFFICVLHLAARRLSGQWKEEPPGERRLWFESTFCAPVFWRSIFRNRLSRKLDRNPVGWLQEFRWHTRVAKWGWCLFILIMEILMVGGFNASELARGQTWLTVLILLGIAFSASVSFSQERENGAMELLLVTPLSESQVIWGRVKGLWSQFLPSVMLLTLVCLYFQFVIGDLIHPGRYWVQSPYYLPLLFGSYGILPLVGLGQSMKSTHLISAWLYSFLIAVALPVLIWLFFPYARPSALGFGTPNPSWILLACQALIGWFAYGRLRRTLVARRFVIR